MSIAFKYACFQTFCIPTEEMVPILTQNRTKSRPKKVRNAQTPPNSLTSLKEQILGKIGEFAKKKGVDEGKGVEWTLAKRHPRNGQWMTCGKSQET